MLSRYSSSLDVSGGVKVVGLRIAEGQCCGAVQLRGKVNALGQAFSQRSDEQRDSTRAHQVSLGAFALEDALAHGRPYAAAASLLSQSCSEDDLVAAALQALPTDSAEKARAARMLVCKMDSVCTLEAAQHGAVCICCV